MTFSTLPRPFVELLFADDFFDDDFLVAIHSPPPGSISSARYSGISNDEGTHPNHRRWLGRKRSGMADCAARAERGAIRDASDASHSGAPDGSNGGAGVQQLAEVGAGGFRAVALEGRTAAARFVVAARCPDRAGSGRSCAHGGPRCLLAGSHEGDRV